MWAIPIILKIWPWYIGIREYPDFEAIDKKSSISVPLSTAIISTKGTIICPTRWCWKSRASWIIRRCSLPIVPECSPILATNLSSSLLALELCWFFPMCRVNKRGNRVIILTIGWKTRSEIRRQCAYRKSSLLAWLRNIIFGIASPKSKRKHVVIAVASETGVMCHWPIKEETFSE